MLLIQADISRWSISPCGLVDHRLAIHFLRVGDPCDPGWWLAPEISAWGSSELEVGVARDEERAIVEAFSGMASNYVEVVDNELQRFWGRSYQGLVNQLVDATAVTELDVLLDLATGTAVIPLNLSRKEVKPARMIGLDITFPMLLSAKENLDHNHRAIALTCGSALKIPFRDDAFDVVTCGLAAHHMDLMTLLAEAKRVLKPGGRLTIADVSVPRAYRRPAIKGLLKLLTFLYFLPGEGLSRASAEAAAVSNVRTTDEWRGLLAINEFSGISISRFPSNRFLIPGLIIVQALKMKTTKETHEHSH